MSERRYLITRVKRRNTLSGGKPVVDLFAGGKDARLQFPVLTLFELSELLAVGINPNELQEGREVACRFWAYYTESDKKNKDGNPYRDVAYLEAIAASATAAPEASGEVLDELRAVRAELAALRAELADLRDLVVDETPATSFTPEPTPVPAPAKPAAAAANPEPRKAATPTDYWTLARRLGKDTETSRRRAADAAKSGDWAGAITRLKQAA